jgi:hypothetical protein
MAQIILKDKPNVRHNQHAQGMAQVAPEDTLESKQDQPTPIKAPVTIGQKFVGLINELIPRMEQMVIEDKPPLTTRSYMFDMCCV